MNTKISPQQILELLQTDGTFDKWKKQITDEFEKSEAEKVKSETRNHVFNSKTLANVTEYIHPKSSTAAYIYKDVQDEIMRSGFSDRIHSQVRRILQIEQDGNTNNNNNDTNASPFTTNLLDTVKSNIESAITKLQEPKTPKDIPTSTPPFQPTQPTAKLKSEPIKQESKVDILPVVKKEPPIKKSAPVVNINGKQHPTVPKKPSLQDPMKLPITPKEGTPKTPTTVPPIQTTAPSITPAAIVPPSTAPIPSQPATKPAAPAVMKPTKAINKAVESSSSSSESSDSDSSSSSSDSDTSDSSSDSDSDSSSSSSESDLDKKVVKKVLPSQSDSKPQNNLPNIQQEPKPVSIKKRSEKRKRKPKKSLESQDNNTDEGTHGGTPKEKKSRRGRLIKPSSWMVGDEESSVPLAKRRKKKRQEDVSGTNEVSPTPDEEDITSIRKKYYRRHKQQEEEQKELEATLEGKHVICIDKKGVIAGSLITCDCCSTAFNFSSFQEHAGCDTGNPWENIHVNDQEKQTLQYFYDQVEAKHSPKKKAKKHHIEDSQSSQIDTQSSQLDVQPATPPTPKSLSARRRKKHSMANSQDGNSSTNPSSGQTSVDDLRQRMKGILSEQELDDLIRMADPTDSGILDEAVCGELISQLQKKSESQGTTEVAT